MYIIKHHKEKTIIEHMDYVSGQYLNKWWIDHDRLTITEIGEKLLLSMLIHRPKKLIFDEDGTGAVLKDSFIAFVRKYNISISLSGDVSYL